MRRSLFLLFLLAAGCRSTRPLQPPLSPAVFHPDGNAIVFSVARGKDCFLYKADSATGTMQRVTSAKDGCESDPTFSPDGRQLAFTYAPENGEHAAVMLANSDGVSADGKRAVLLHQGDFLVLDLNSLQIRKVPLQWQ